MVVSHLESYIEKEIPEALKLGNLRELITQELKYERGRPTIILDASATRFLFTSSSIVLSQPRLVRNNVKHFVESIISCGARVIVVLRGNDTHSLRYWFYKKRVNFKRSKESLQSYLEGNVQEIEGCDYNPCIRNTFCTISNNHYSVFVSSQYTHKDVAEIAIKQNCLAVIGQDSNYLIYEGIRYYILTRSMDIETLNCKICDRTKLIEHLKIKSYHLPLFATVCGNDVTYPRMCQGNTKKIFHSSDKFLFIAQRIKCFSEEPYNHINDLLNLINCRRLQGDVIKRSLDMYLNFEKRLPEDELLVFANERKRINKWGCPLYQIFTQKRFWCDMVTSVFGESGFTLCRPLRSRIYGILFYEDAKQVVLECALDEQVNLCKDQSLVHVEVPATKPDCKHPGLFQLYSDYTPNVYNLRWNLFCTSIDRNLNQFTIKSLPPGLVYPILALRYLEREVPVQFSQRIFKEKFEIEMFLVVALLVHENMFGPHLENYEFIRADARVIHLTFYFLEAYFTLQLLNEACGLVLSKEKSCFCNFFDGILLHSVYEKMSRGTKWHEFFGSSLALQNLFPSLMEIILQGTTH